MKTKIAMVGYHNTLPFSYGLAQFENQFQTILDVPSKCMEYFNSGEVDIALVPIANLIFRDDFDIITDYCIGCNGAVGTVCVFANLPIEKTNKIYLDKDSRTSQLLTKLLVAQYWKIDVEYEEIDVNTLNAKKLPANTAVLMIGDKVFGKSNTFNFSYDLGEEWNNFTGLPFVFAVWIARKNLDSKIADLLNEVLKIGTENINDVVSEYNKKIKNIDLKEYFNHYIDYKYDDAKKRAFQLYCKNNKVNV
ncbi:MAG: menaquinone biosynthesis protein [Saprospiraceae bacterium]